MGNISVVDEGNIDIVIHPTALHKPGEPTLGGEFLMTPGCKEANQEVTVIFIFASGIFSSCSLKNNILTKQPLKGESVYCCLLTFDVT